MLREKKIAKKYFAIVENKPPDTAGKLSHFLKRDTGKKKSWVHKTAVEGSKECVLDYKMVSKKNSFYLLEIKPATGRKHQIRAQLSAMGCAILGDVKYGFPQPLPDASIALHASELQFIHPVKKEPITIQAPLPETKWWKKFS